MSENTQLTTIDEEETKIEANITTVPSTPGYDNPDVKELGVVSEDHHAVEEVGKSAMKKTAGSGAGKFISEQIYDHDKKFVREWLQNQEAACVRKAKFLIRNSDQFPEGWLVINKWIDTNTGETIAESDTEQTQLAEYDGDVKHVREIAVPRRIDEVLEAVRSLGYDPTIVWDVFRDERKIVTTDNGDGMTPTEFDKYFNSPFESLSDEDGETGGKFGVGSESAAIVHGEDGGMDGCSRSIKPDENGNVRPGFRFYSYMGGANFVPGEVEDDFTGTRFNIPVKEKFHLSRLQSWVEHYANKLRVPLLYREHNAGATPVEEEYEATYFTEDYPDAPIKIERPGEFTVVSGPNVYDDSYNSDDDNTFLVSMPIERNTRASINTLWNTVIQIHDEQGRIVAGPNRGRYRSDVDELDDRDVALPQPVGSRDQLSRDSMQKNFFYFIEELVENEEVRKVSDLVKKIAEADYAHEAVRNNNSDWTLFKKVAKSHSGRRVTKKKSKFEKFINNTDEFPNLDAETLEQAFNLFTSIEKCTKGPSRSSKKKYRSSKHIGTLLSHTDPENVYMAASTGGKFAERFKVVNNTNPDATVIVVDGADKYDRYGKQFGFKVLKEVPVTDTDEQNHDYDVPDNIHENNIRTSSTTQSKPDKVEERTLKFRTDASNSSIDVRKTIAETIETLEDYNHIDGKKKIVLYPRTDDKNISDHYDMAEYAAIASVSKTEYEKLAHLDAVMTHDEYVEWSNNALIATEDGAMTPKEIIEDDRMVVLAYRGTTGHRDYDIAQLLADDKETLRNYYCEDIQSQLKWAKILPGFDGGYKGDDVGNVPDDVKPDTLFAVAGNVVLDRANLAFKLLRQETQYDRTSLVGMKLDRKKYDYKNPCRWKTLDESTNRYKLMADTPNWDDDSRVYDMFPSSTTSWKAQILLGFHDRGIDPSEKDAEELRKLISDESS